MSAGAVAGGAPGPWGQAPAGRPGADPRALEHALREVAPERWEAYEALLQALADGQVWMLLWHGTPGSPDAQYGNMEISGHGYAPAVTSPEQLAASGWTRAHEVISGREIAASLYRTRWGLWLNPHAPGGGVGVPWADLRRIAAGLDRLPAGPLKLSEPQVPAQQFFALLERQAVEVRAVRSLRRAWVQPSVGEPYLAIGLDLYESSPPTVEAVRALMQRAIAVAPEGLAVSTVAMGDEYDPVALWMRANARPFYDREAGGRPATGPYPPVPPPPYPSQAGPGYAYGTQPPAQGWQGQPPPQQPWPGYPGR
ncbi:enhanced serine sensitivity protein SseB C-terminal domain-containing protein [Kitasatospora sp. A2-31]|uniref:enhanced serine sensitivity protein SseB C-terminal domain-containing protein n=1 Tax=Kitasatospora sp. A2-31 TaxID=2916414 RepID=UPI001EEB4006|nr:enhanced serine sensitivity protein SseB C-terminal domain-containing protein [Kitasatospora sp. A2-31]MCG6498568.1 enhanced serine sensitivity protein SseB C-terminal domain-containing protein [Kitasatospora sp. A2-31]